MEQKPEPPPQQRIVLFFALLLFAVVAIPSTVIALLCYLAALLLANIILSVNPSWVPWQAGSRGQRWLAMILLVALPGAFVVRMLLSTNPPVQADTVRENLADRIALEQLPAIFPGLLSTAEPQRFLIYAPEASQVSVRLTAQSEELSAVDLGSGVHLLDVNPRMDPALQETRGPDLECTITFDNKAVQRRLRLIRSQPHPRMLRSDPKVGIAVTVSEETDELILVQRDGKHRRVPVGDGPTDCALFDEGRKAAIAHRFTPELWVIDTLTSEVLSKFPADKFQTKLAVSPNGLLLAIAGNDVKPALRLIRLSDLQNVVRVMLPFSPELIEFSDDNLLVVTDRSGRAIHRVAAAGTEWKLVDGPLLFPRPITALGKTPKAGELALALTASYLTDQQPIANHFIENTIHTLDTDKWQIISTRITDRRGLQQDDPGNTEHGISPLAIAVIDGRQYAAFTGSNEIGELPPAGVFTSYFPLDAYPLFAPRGLADLGAGAWCVSSSCEGTIGVFDRQGALRELIRLAASEEELAKNEPAALQRRQGERTFFEGTRAGIACQSCHLDAVSDGCLHHIGQNKPVDVLSVRGIAGTSPYLRDASHWRLRDLHDLAQVGYRDHQRQVPWDRAAAVAAYMESLPPEAHARINSAFDLERMRAGLAVFFAASCNACHTPPALTNLGQHSALSMFPDYFGLGGQGAGTDNFLDTPSLRGLAVSAPYLHDGRAKTLRALLTEWNRANRHGNTRDLSAQQIDDLIYFLERL